jgi:hypothetical protein
MAIWLEVHFVFRMSSYYIGDGIPKVRIQCLDDAVFFFLMDVE